MNLLNHENIHTDIPGKRRIRKLEDEYAKLWQMYGDLEGERDRLRQLLEKAIPAVAGRVRHLRSLNDPRSLQLTNDLADMNAALQEDRDES